MCVLVLWQPWGGHATCSDPVFKAPPPVCPGEMATFVCKSQDDTEIRTTVWDVSEPLAPYGGCPLLHYLWPETSVICGSFTGHSTDESPNACFHSELRVTATLALNGSNVTCYFAADEGQVYTRGTGNLQVIGIYT